MDLDFLPCPQCREITIFEVPPSTDEHDSPGPDARYWDDTERACTVCGLAISYAGATFVELARPTTQSAGRRQSAAEQQSSAKQPLAAGHRSRSVA